MGDLRVFTTFHERSCEEAVVRVTFRQFYDLCGIRNRFIVLWVSVYLKRRREYTQAKMRVGRGLVLLAVQYSRRWVRGMESFLLSDYLDGSPWRELNGSQ